MSVVDPGGGVVDGGVIVVEQPGTGGSGSSGGSSAAPAESSELTWNDKTVLLPLPVGAGSDERFGVYPLRPRTINRSLTGRAEILTQPRMEVSVKLTWNKINDQLLTREGLTALTIARLRTQLMNWWQCAQQGMDWTFALYSNRKVYTTLGGSPAVGAALGATVLLLASTDGVMVGNTYALIGGPNYQEMEVVAVDTTTKQVQILSGLDFAFAPGSLFRDVYFWHGVILDPAAAAPLEDIPPPEGQFALEIQFVERLVGT